ncbi:MAG: 4'-phosphopantetheinyl transferase superfamily protein [Mogibacterium sp.]|nr:4'-phosphopantetheinyl transferase superfamily protein [Mogibacterium sp.]
MIIYYTENFMGGRAESRRLLRKSIAEYTGDAKRAEELVSGLQTGENGKPYIEGFDCFSVSHTGGIWAVLIDIRECGLDIQLGRKADVPAISRRIYAQPDADKIAALQEEDPVKAADEFFRLWARREALTKALGGTVYDTGLPSVMADELSVNCASYRISDVSFPDTGLEDGKKLYAAVCVESGKETEDKSSELRPVYVGLNEG